MNRVYILFWFGLFSSNNISCFSFSFLQFINTALIKGRINDVVPLACIDSRNPFMFSTVNCSFSEIYCQVILKSLI